MFGKFYPSVQKHWSSFVNNINNRENNIPTFTHYYYAIDKYLNQN